MNLFKSNRVLAIDVGASGLKLAEFAATKDGMELLNFGVHTFTSEPGGDVDTSLEIMEGIQAVLKAKKIRPAPVALSVTGQSAFMRLVKLPPVNRNKIHKTVEYEALQNVPFPINEVVWDYQLMGESADELNVMLVAIKTDIVQGITDCVEAAGLELDLVDVAPMALYNAVRYNYSELEDCTLVIDIGSRATNLVFIEEGRFFSRNLPVVGTGNGITQQLMKEFDLSFKDADELKCAHASVAFGGAYEDHADMVVSRVSKAVRSAMTRLHVEVERSINFYRTQQGGAPPKNILLAGGTSIIERMDEFFKEKLRLDVDYFNPFKNIFVNDALSAEEVAASAHMMGEAVGVGLRHFLPCPLEINLVPPRIIAEKRFRRQQPFLIAAGLSLALIFVCWGAYFSRMAQLIGEHKGSVIGSIVQLEAVENRLRPIENRKADLQLKSMELAALVPLRTEWPVIFDSIHSALLDGMWLISITPVSGAMPEPEKLETLSPVVIRRMMQRMAQGHVPYTRILIKGMIFADKATDKSISEFRDKLREAEWFTDETEIQWLSLLHQDDYAREFIIEIALAKPLI